MNKKASQRLHKKRLSFKINDIIFVLLVYLKSAAASTMVSLFIS